MFLWAILTGDDRGQSRTILGTNLLIVDIFSRKIVGWEVYGRESAEDAFIVVRRAVWAESCLTSATLTPSKQETPHEFAGQLL